MVEKIPIAVSSDAEISRRIEELIRKLAEGVASQNDVQMLHELQKRRVDLMRPREFSKRRAPVA
jgi:hypothetical protein